MPYQALLRSKDKPLVCDLGPDASQHREWLTASHNMHGVQAGQSTCHIYLVPLDLLALAPTSLNFCAVTMRFQEQIPSLVLTVSHQRSRLHGGFDFPQSASQTVSEMYSTLSAYRANIIAYT